MLLDLSGEEPPGIGKVALVAAPEKTVAVEETSDGSGGVGSAREAEEIDLVAFVIDLHEVAVGVEDVVFEAGTEGEALDDGPLALEPITGAGVAHGSDAGVIVA